MAHHLASVAALAFVCAGLVDSVEVCAKVDFLVRICVIAEPIVLCVLAFKVTIMSFPKRTPRLNSSLPCLAISQDISHSLFIVRRIVDFVIAISVWSDLDCGGGSSTIRVSRSYPAAILIMRSAASLLDTPTCIEIH